MVATVYGFIHVAHSGWNNAETYTVFIAAVVLLVAFVVYEAKIVAEPMMPMRIFENRNRSGTYLVMFVVGAAMFGMFYFITFFAQGVLDFSALKTGFSFLPVALVIGIVSQIVARLLGKTGPKPLLMLGTVLITCALLWFSRVSASSGYAGTLLPGMVVLAVAMGCLFVPLTSTAVAGVANTDAGLASALLNVGQQVGGALGLSVMTTVFGTAGRNYASSHSGDLRKQLAQSAGGDQSLAGAIAGRVSKAGNNGLQPEDIKKFIGSLPAEQRTKAASFFSGPYKDFTHGLLAHASGQGFLMGAVFGVVAIIAAVALINVKKADLPGRSDGGRGRGLIAAPTVRIKPRSPRATSGRTEIDSPGSYASALDDVDGEAAARGLLVLDLHVGAGLAHRLDHLVEADDVPAVAAQRDAGGVDRLDRGHGVALDAGHLNQPAHGVAGQAEVVLHADLGRVLHLLGRAAEHLAQRAGGHRAGRAHLALAADLGPRDRRVLLVEHADRSGAEQEPHHAVVVRAGAEAHVVVQHRRQHAGGAVRRRGDDPASGRVLLVDGQREQVDPVHDAQRIGDELLVAQPPVELGRAPTAPSARRAGCPRSSSRCARIPA